jgi:hypothetical protein
MKNRVWEQLEIPFDSEEWRPVVGYEGLYEVSNQGRVKSLGNGKTHKTIKLLKPKYTNDGYIETSLCKDGKQKSYKIHRLIALAFVPNDDPKHKTQVNHKDECKTNNFVWVNEDGTINPERSNLEWMTPKENTNWGTSLKRRAKAISKPVKQLMSNGVLVTIWPSTMEAERNGFNHKCVSRCCLGHKKKYKGYIWKYI